MANCVFVLCTLHAPELLRNPHHNLLQFGPLHVARRASSCHSCGVVVIGLPASIILQSTRKACSCWTQLQDAQHSALHQKLSTNFKMTQTASCVFVLCTLYFARARTATEPFLHLPQFATIRTFACRSVLQLAPLVLWSCAVSIFLQMSSWKLQSTKCAPLLPSRQHKACGRRTQLRQDVRHSALNQQM